MREKYKFDLEIINTSAVTTSSFPKPPALEINGKMVFEDHEPSPEELENEIVIRSR